MLQLINSLKINRPLRSRDVPPPRRHLGRLVPAVLRRREPLPPGVETQRSVLQHHHFIFRKPQGNQTAATQQPAPKTAHIGFRFRSPGPRIPRETVKLRMSRASEINQRNRWTE